MRWEVVEIYWNDLPPWELKISTKGQICLFATLHTFNYGPAIPNLKEQETDTKSV